MLEWFNYSQYTEHSRVSCKQQKRLAQLIVQLPRVDAVEQARLLKEVVAKMKAGAQPEMGWSKWLKIRTPRMGASPELTDQLIQALA